MSNTQEEVLNLLHEQLDKECKALNIEYNESFKALIIASSNAVFENGAEE